MSDTPSLTIGADGLDTDAIVREIRERVAQRRARGEYDEAAVARAARFNRAPLQDAAQFLERYLACLRQAAQVDINDFEIVERRARMAPLLKRLKQGIWSLLRFYTYRLWSQQNQVNGMLLAATEIIATRDQERLDRLEARIRELEARPGSAGKPS